MTGDELEKIRNTLRTELDGLMSVALSRYTDFARTDPAEDPKGFAAHQAACRAALAHLDALVKLARWSMGEAGCDPNAETEDQLTHRLIAQARADLETRDGFNELASNFGEGA